MANATEFGLVAGVFTQDITAAMTCLSDYGPSGIRE